MCDGGRAPNATTELRYRITGESAFGPLRTTKHVRVRYPSAETGSASPRSSSAPRSPITRHLLAIASGRFGTSRSPLGFCGSALSPRGFGSLGLHSAGSARVGSGHRAAIIRRVRERSRGPYKWRLASVGIVRQPSQLVIDPREQRARSTVPGTPFSVNGPCSSKLIPDPATRSRTVLVTSVSPDPARPATRAPMWTAIPARSSPRTSHSPV